MHAKKCVGPNFVQTDIELRACNIVESENALVYGCNCDGGCRKNQGIGHKELKQAWLAQLGLTKWIIVDA